MVVHAHFASLLIDKVDPQNEAVVSLKRVIFAKSKNVRRRKQLLRHQISNQNLTTSETCRDGSREELKISSYANDGEVMENLRDVSAIGEASDRSLHRMSLASAIAANCVSLSSRWSCSCNYGMSVAVGLRSGLVAVLIADRHMETIKLCLGKLFKKFCVHFDLGFDGVARRILQVRPAMAATHRSPEDILRLIAFYTVFYTVLFGMTAMLLAAVLPTLDDGVPPRFGPGSLIGVHPGVGYQPWIEEDPDSTLIKFSPTVKISYRKYVDVIRKYFGKYSAAGTRTCNETDSNAKIVTSGIYNLGDKPCRVDTDRYQTHCSPLDGYGYAAGQPCVILTLNRLIGWQPEDYAPDEVPGHVKEKYRIGSVLMHCDGASDHDREVIGKVSYFPENGIDGRYYPYARMPNYHQPFAMVKFESLPMDHLVRVECKAYAKNVAYSEEDRIGLVHFELLLKSNATTHETTNSSEPKV
ncbi:hypothetical protein L596_001360 [Steinernema carpocapsae]|uniref:Sodium/potassium-transporting ATPase subunit beta n=1 Tax=Steinernema carpocapsae TaxID=34508 RepID=A0A4U8ULJ3_STECR|nr:hypothetical protein L596_001360 [Steinernema carpocapsae]